MVITKEKRSAGKEVENVGVRHAILDVVIYSRKEMKAIVTGERERDYGGRWGCVMWQEAGQASP